MLTHNSDPTPEEEQALDALFASAHETELPLETPRMREAVFQEITSSAPQPGRQSLLAFAAALALLGISLLILPQQLQPSSNDWSQQENRVVEITQAASPESLSIPLRHAVLDPYREQEETLRADILRGVAFLDRALPL